MRQFIVLLSLVSFAFAQEMPADAAPAYDRVVALLESFKATPEEAATALPKEIVQPLIDAMAQMSDPSALQRESDQSETGQTRISPITSGILVGGMPSLEALNKALGDTGAKFSSQPVSASTGANMFSAMGSMNMYTTFPTANEMMEGTAESQRSWNMVYAEMPYAMGPAAAFLSPTNGKPASVFLFYLFWYEPIYN